MRSLRLRRSAAPVEMHPARTGPGTPGSSSRGWLLLGVAAFLVSFLLFGPNLWPGRPQHDVTEHEEVANLAQRPQDSSQSEGSSGKEQAAGRGNYENRSSSSYGAGSGNGHRGSDGDRGGDVTDGGEGPHAGGGASEPSRGGSVGNGGEASTSDSSLRSEDGQNGPDSRQERTNGGGSSDQSDDALGGREDARSPTALSPIVRCSLAASLIGVHQLDEATQVLQPLIASGQIHEVGCASVLTELWIKSGRGVMAADMLYDSPSIDPDEIVLAAELYLINGKQALADHLFERVLASCEAEFADESEENEPCAGIQARALTARAHVAILSGQPTQAVASLDVMLASPTAKDAFAHRASALWTLVGRWMTGEDLELGADRLRLAWECAMAYRCAVPASMAEQAWTRAITAKAVGRTQAACAAWVDVHRFLADGAIRDNWSQNVKQVLKNELGTCGFGH